MNRFFSSHSFKVIMVVIFLLPVFSRGARKTLTSNDNRVEDWLPAEYDETQDLKWFKKHFENETFILISWDGCNLADQRQEVLAQKLLPPADVAQPGGGEPLFKKIETGQRLVKRMTEPPLSLSETEALRRLRGLFVGPAPQSGEVDDTQTCAIITLTDYGKKDLRKTLATVYKMCDVELGLKRSRVRMGGPPVDNVAISTEGEKTLMWLLGPAGLVGVSLAFWCLRSVRLTMMVFCAALYAGAVSLAIIYYSGGTMNAILLTMPAVVYVAGISGAIHFANYYRDSAVEGGVEGAPARAVKHAWLPCTLSAVTSAAGLVSLYTSELLPIKLFGLYTAAGVLVTLFLLFLFLPSWMQLWPMRGGSVLDGSAPKEEDLALPARWRYFLQGVIHHHRLVFVGLGAVMVFCCVGLTKINTSIKLTKMFSPHAEIIHNYEWLEENLGPLVPMEIVLCIDNSRCKLNMLERMQLLDRMQQKLLQTKGIGNTMSAVTFAMPLEVKRSGAFINKKTMAGILNKKLLDHRDEYLASGFLSVEGDTEMWRISARVGALNDMDYGEFIQDIKREVEPVLRAQREVLAKAADAVKRAGIDEDRSLEDEIQRGAIQPVKFEVAEKPSLSQAVKSQSLSGKSVGADTSAAKANAAALSQARAAMAKKTSKADNQGITAVYTGLVPVVYKAQRAMLDGLAWNFVTDLMTIAGVMTVVFWDVSAALILLVPSVFPVICVFGLMGWLGVVIDVGTIMTPTVALGVSVDDVVHFLIWYRRGLSEGKTRQEAIMLAYEGCARAMYQSWSVLGLGLAVFALSSFVPTQRFGAMMFCLLTAALIGNLLMMPAVLASPLAYFFGGRLVRRAKRNAAREAALQVGSPSHDQGLSDRMFSTDRPQHEAIPSPTLRRDGSHRSLQS